MFKTNYRLMQVKSNAECSNDSEYKGIGILLSEIDIGSPITDIITYDSSIQRLIKLMPVSTVSGLDHNCFPMLNIS